MGAAPGYRLERTAQAGKTADAASCPLATAGVEAKKRAAGWGVFWRR